MLLLPSFKFIFELLAGGIKFTISDLVHDTTSVISSLLNFLGDRNKLKTTAGDSQNFPALPDLRNYCRSVRAEVGVSYISLC